ncbi:MAG: hypothetical protein AAGJ18_09410, partial [Bacteroidota bacterium]
NCNYLGGLILREKFSIFLSKTPSSEEEKEKIFDFFFFFLNWPPARFSLLAVFFEVSDILEISDT